MRKNFNHICIKLNNSSILLKTIFYLEINTINLVSYRHLKGKKPGILKSNLSNLLPPMKRYLIVQVTSLFLFTKLIKKHKFHIFFNEIPFY